VPAYNNPVTYAISAGNANGLIINPNTGVISGTPASSGSSTFTVTVNGSTAGLPPGQQNVIKYTVQLDVH